MSEKIKFHPSQLKLNAKSGQSIRTLRLMLFIQVYRPNAVAPTGFNDRIFGLLSATLKNVDSN